MIRTTRDVVRQLTERRRLARHGFDDHDLQIVNSLPSAVQFLSIVQTQGYRRENPRQTLCNEPTRDSERRSSVLLQDQLLRSCARRRIFICRIQPTQVTIDPSSNISASRINPSGLRPRSPFRQASLAYILPRSIRTSLAFTFAVNSSISRRRISWESMSGYHTTTS